MNQERYIKERVDDQISWYNGKSAKNKKAYRTLRVLGVAIALSIPVMSGFLTNENAGGLKFLISIAGAAVALCEALLTLYKFRDNWTNYRNSAENLTQHKFLFAAGASPYNVPDAFILFVQTCEGIMSGERVAWLKTQTAPEEKPAPKEESSEATSGAEKMSAVLPSDVEFTPPETPSESLPEGKELPDSEKL